MLVLPTRPLEDDAALVAALRRGELDAAERLLEGYGDRVHTLAVRLTRTAAEAAASVEEALTTALREVATLERASSLGPWLCGLTARAAYRRLLAGERHAAVRLDDLVPAIDEHGHFEPLDDWSDRIDAPGIAGVLRQRVSESIATLPPTHRTALVLHDQEGMSTDEIADVLGVNTATVSRLVHDARLFVRTRLSGLF